MRKGATISATTRKGLLTEIRAGVKCRNMNAVEARLLDGFAQDSPRRTAGSLNRAIGLIRRKTRIRQTRSHRLHFAVWRTLCFIQKGLQVWRSRRQWRRVLAGLNSLPTCMMLRSPPRCSISGRRWVGSPSCKLFRHGGMRETSVYLARFPMPSRLPMRANPVVQRPCTTSPYPVLCFISPIPPTGSRILL